MDRDTSASFCQIVANVEKAVPRGRKKTAAEPPRPIHRDGMGRYRVPQGGKPLTVNDIPGPGPNEYNPEFTNVAKKYPLWSFGERSEDSKRIVAPAPNRYNVSGNLNWGRCKRFTIKNRLSVKDKNLAYPGPAAYMLPRSITSGPKFTMRLKPKSGYTPGLVNKFGFLPEPKNPGPDYNTSSLEWLRKPQSFGSKQKEMSKFIGPGPEKYFVPDKPIGPMWSIGKAAPGSIKRSAVPGPETYTKKSTIGDAPKFSFGIHHTQCTSKFITPGPDVYNRARLRLDEPGYTMKYRWFEPRQDPRPGPYTFKDDPIKKKSPAFSMGSKVKPTYPSSVYSNLREYGPAPNQYDVPRDPLKNGKTLSNRPRQRDSEIGKTPGPADYQDPETVKVILPRAPAYSIGGKWKTRIDSMPGPGEYDVIFKNTTPGKTFGVKFETKTPKAGSDAMYGPVDPIKMCSYQCDVVRGATLKSRHTPNKYTGLKDSAKLLNRPFDFPDAPLLG